MSAIGANDGEQAAAAPPTVSPETVSQRAEAAGALRSGTAPLQLPFQFGRYRLEKLLGKGGMGAVYLAHDAQLDRRVALKIPRFGPDDDAGRERFLREARAAATLHHPNLCPVFDAGKLDGVSYLTMAYLEGEPLSAKLGAGRPMPLRQAVELVRMLSLALQEAHAHGIIHRDLKPANIMIGLKNEPVIMDFGLARRETVEDDRLTQSGAVMGTPAYMPPEQVTGDLAAMGPGCDIYSLGVILYELLGGRRPFDGTAAVLMAQILRDPAPPLVGVQPGLDGGLEAICLQALAKRPQDRHASMRALGEALERWLAGTEPPPIPIPVATMVRRQAPLATVVAPAERPTERPRHAEAKARQKQKLPLISTGQKWLLIVSTVVLFACILPSGVALVVVYLGVSATIDGIARFGGWVERVNKEQQQKEEKERQEAQQWEDARGWSPPPEDAVPMRLFPLKVGRYERIEQDDQANVPGLLGPAQGMMPPLPPGARVPPGAPGAPALPGAQQPGRSGGQRALYEGPGGKVEIFAYRMKRNDKDSAVQRAVAALGQDGVGMPGLGLLTMKIKGSATGTYLSYERPAGEGIVAQRGIFWWDRDWLFLARTQTGPNPGEFLLEYIQVVGAKDAGK
jgi:predicted Ser/Thr protein kinase